MIKDKLFLKTTILTLLFSIFIMLSIALHRVTAEDMPILASLSIALLVIAAAIVMSVNIYTLIKSISVQNYIHLLQVTIKDNNNIDSYMAVLSDSDVEEFKKLLSESNLNNISWTKN